MNALLESVLRPLLDTLVARWDAADAPGYAALFTADAEFVDVLGRQFHGRAAIEDIHAKNFASIHRASHVRLEPDRASALGDGVLLAHVHALLDVPTGPLAGQSRATQTLVLVHDEDAWHIRAFHNTFVRAMPGVPS